MAEAAKSQTTNESKSLVARMASNYGVDPAKFWDALKQTAFKQKDGQLQPTDEQMLALLVVADQHGLNPFLREIYAYPDRQNGIIPVVGVDGWSRIINSHGALDGFEFEYSDKMVRMPGALVDAPEWIEVVFYRKDRRHPIRVREYLDEVYRKPFQGQDSHGNPYTVNGPWQTHTKRQIRHKTLIQGARLAFGFSGIYDRDEAERISEAQGGIVVEGDFRQMTDVSANQPVIEHKELDRVLKGLADRAISQNVWSAAYQYAEDRYTGTELEYAKRFLRKAEADAEMTQANADSQNAGEQPDVTRVAVGSQEHSDVAVA